MQTRLLHHVSPFYLTSITERDSLSVIVTLVKIEGNRWNDH